MVTAGVYLLMRTSPLIEYSSTVLILCLWIGSITTVFSSLIGLFQQDIKKVIAYSTMSQLAQEFFKFRHQTIYEKILINTMYNIYTTIIFIWTILYIFNTNIFRYFFFLLNNMCLSCLLICFAGQTSIIEHGNKINPTLSSKNFKQDYNLKSLFNNYKQIKSGNSYTIVNKLSAKGVGKRYYSTIINKNYCNDSLFNEWLSGLIDGHGEFILSKKGYASFKIIVSTSDKTVLYAIKHKYGGSIKNIAGSNSCRYKLHSKKGLIKLISSVNGHIRNPTRILKLYKICLLYNIKLNEAKPLTYNNAWFSGFIDADGSIYLNEQSDQLSITISQKNKYLLDPLISLYSGRVQPVKSKEAFQYSINKKKEVLDLVDNYLSKYPLKSGKIHKLSLIKKFYLYKDYMHLDVYQLDKHNEWIKFKKEWDKL